MGTKDLPACPQCAETKAVRKIIRSPMVHFKGTGFYTTDSSGGMKQKKEEAPPISEAGKESKELKETKPTETKPTESKPAEKKPETKK